MPVPGEIVKLIIASSTPGGYDLDLGNEETVFLPFEDLTHIVKEGQEIEVFLFHNENNDMEATTKLPRTSIGRYAGFLPKTITSIGSFFDIGAKRDVLVPLRESDEEIERGRPYLLTLKYDPLRNRLCGSTRIGSFLKRKDIELEHKQMVDIIFHERLPIGWKLVVNGKYSGLLLKQDTHQRYRIGDTTQGYVKKVEETSVVIIMQKEGIGNLLESKERVLNYLKTNGGYARIGDHTDPEEIKLRLRMSKGSFKSAIGMLAKDGELVITKRGIKLPK